MDRETNNRVLIKNKQPNFCGEKLITIDNLKKLKIKDLSAVCADLREQLIEVVRQSGGHLASNLGTVELLVALNYVYGEDDKFVFDVGHQSYVHRILRGNKDFSTLRQQDGFSAFPQLAQGDDYGAGHSSIAISAALGLAAARDKDKKDFDVVAVVGDGALTGGISFEGLNNIDDKKMLIILNDNQMSISRNVGNLTKGLKKMRVGERYITFKGKAKRFLKHIPLLGRLVIGIFGFFKEMLKLLFVPNTYFENFNVKYIGPIDGHNLDELISTLRYIKKNTKRPVLLHVVTTKGKGMEEAENQPQEYHGISVAANLDIFSLAAGEALSEMARQNDKIVAVTAAMADGTGLKNFSKNFPDKFFDVGIAEEHAVAFCAGLSAGGYEPYFAVYSTFLQRSFDQLTTELAIQNLNCTLLVDRAGFSGGDGATHQGLYDISFLSCIPNLTLFAPSNTAELKEMLKIKTNGIKAIRYPKGSTEISYDVGCITRWHTFGSLEGCQAAVLAVGPRMLEQAMQAAKLLCEKNIKTVVVSARCLKPLDEQILQQILNQKNLKHILTIEENMLLGGFGSMINSFVKGAVRTTNLGVDNKIVPQGSIYQQMCECGLTAEKIIECLTDYS